MTCTAKNSTLPASSFGGYAYDAMHDAVQAMEKAGDDRAKIRDALEGRPKTTWE
jgi:ABC-type branched-subunit amino acid transport system substrate-binding protein